MTVLKEFCDKAATTAWCPISGSSMIALGTKDSSGLDDYNGELEIYSLDFLENKNQAPKQVGKWEEEYIIFCSLIGTFY